jgi:proteic killer suppression protein
MIQSFRHPGVEDIFNGVDTQAGRRVCPSRLWHIAARKLEQLDSVEFLKDLRIPPGNRLEALKGNRRGQYSIRINNQFRICFIWTEQGPSDVEIIDYH